ncbi:hypothetical protein E8E11_003419 [Didymella keratinophila]|nr:hypothetical protein E8E11_003419 [Didymella keratinophila]
MPKYSIVGILVRSLGVERGAGFNFTIPSAIRNVLITGATGSVGAPILTALLAEPTFKVTILSRGTSSATFPPSGPVIKVSDDYTLSELTAALKNQDAVISPDFTTSSLSVIEELEQQTGQKWDLDWRVSAPKLAKLREQYDAGDFNATYGLLALSFSADVDVGYDFETGQELWNERLGLPKVRLEEVIADAIKLA